MATNILVVDDSLVERVLVEGLLRKDPTYQIQLAANGQVALEVIEKNAPDLVVTDLVMPEMDGLELVRVIRHRYPAIPVILMTAYGDESTAVEALESGAASYVPKAQKAERLIASVERVTEYAAINWNREQLARRMLEYHCRFSLENDRRLIRAMVAGIQQVMAGMEFGDAVERIRVSEALEEALLNAMYHGNLEIGRKELAAVRSELDDHMLDRLIEERCKDPKISDRRILTVAHITKEEARFVIRDEGRGFDPKNVGSESTSDRFASGHDRGMILIRSLMDEVRFNKTGNELVIRKCLQHTASKTRESLNSPPAQ
jgi:CheY-like chemotaxis protein